MRFHLGITGKGRLPTELYTQEGQNLLAELCKGPVSRHKIADNLLNPFAAVGALRLEGILVISISLAFAGRSDKPE